MDGFTRSTNEMNHNARRTPTKDHKNEGKGSGIKSPTYGLLEKVKVGKEVNNEEKMSCLKSKQSHSVYAYATKSKRLWMVSLKSGSSRMLVLSNSTVTRPLEDMSRAMKSYWNCEVGCSDCGRNVLL